MAAELEAMGVVSRQEEVGLEQLGDVCQGKEKYRGVTRRKSPLTLTPLSTAALWDRGPGY